MPLTIETYICIRSPRSHDERKSSCFELMRCRKRPLRGSPFRVPSTSLNISSICATNVIPDKDQDIVVYYANADCDGSPKLAEKLTEMATRIFGTLKKV